MTGYPLHQAHRVIEAKRQASSCPVVTETSGGRFLVKLRGAAQGTGALIAEMIGNELARCLGLHVPNMTLITLNELTTSHDNHAELADLLRMSYGLNLGFEYLPHARLWSSSDSHAVDEIFTALVFWLDGLVMNVDRTPKNPNILWSGGKPWLIDYGASLHFQYQWGNVTEDMPRNAGFLHNRHLFFEQAAVLEDIDCWATECITREILHTIIQAIPDDFFMPLLPVPTFVALNRRRSAYAAFLWKRLHSPRPFVRDWLDRYKQPV